MITVSFCMIARNEETTIARCLDSIKDIVDEIVIVDTGSTDSTKEICSRYTDKIYDFPWIDDFSAARNFAFSKCTLDYIFYLDADDVLLEEDRQKFMELKASIDPNVDSVTMHYNLLSDEKGNVTFSLRRNRLVKRSRNFKWIGPVHEYLEVYGLIINSDIAITHKEAPHEHSDRNLKIYERRLEKNENFTPRDLYYYANELRDHAQYEKAAEYYQKFLDTKLGWVEDNIAACGKLADIYGILKNPEKELEYILKSFEYDAPRADFCCRMGYRFLQANMIKQAIYWYEAAARLELPKDNWGMVNHACYTWLPHLQLSVCYDRLGLHQLAYEHNEKAAEYVPDHASVKHNRSYFEKILEIQPSDS